MNTQKLTAEYISPMLAGANAAYIARTLPGEQNLTKSGVQVDIARAQSILSKITPTQWDAVNALGLGDDVIAGLSKLAKATSTKVVMRAVDVLAFVAGGSIPPASGRTFALAIGAVCVANCTTRDGLRFAVTGKGNMNTSDGVNLAVSRNLQKIGCTSPASFDTQYSVAFSPDGLGSVFGIGARGKKNEMPSINRDAPMTRALMNRLAALTDIEIIDLTEKVKGDSAKPPKAPRKGKSK